MNKFEMIPVHDLVPYKKNSKKHSESQIEALARSIAKFGFNAPILIWGDKNEVVAGHARLMAARSIEMKEVPCVRLDHLSDAERRAYVIADNKLSEGQGYDTEVLMSELNELAEMNFDINYTGFDMEFLADGILDANPLADEAIADAKEGSEYENEDHEIIGDDDRKLGESETEDEMQSGDAYDPREEETEDLPIPSSVPQRVTLGDTWKLGAHLLKCGDSSKAELVHALIDANSAHSLVSDPPYGISFMGKEWDHGVPSAELWKVWESRLKPGAHLLSFCATRMYHHMAINIENAGFEPRDMLQWLYGQGFPKSHNIALAIDKQLGVESASFGENPNIRGRSSKIEGGSDYGGFSQAEDAALKAATSPEAKKFEGWGTALKPANEPIMLAMKPISEKTIAKNVLKHGTGGLNIDGTRVGSEVRHNGPASTKEVQTMGRPGQAGSGWNEGFEGTTVTGRFPSNVIFSHADGCEMVGSKKVKGQSSGGQATQKKIGSSIPLSGVRSTVSHGDEDGTETVEDWRCVDEIRFDASRANEVLNARLHSLLPDSQSDYQSYRDFYDGLFRCVQAYDQDIFPSPRDARDFFDWVTQQLERNQNHQSPDLHSSLGDFLSIAVKQNIFSNRSFSKVDSDEKTSSMLGTLYKEAFAKLPNSKAECSKSLIDKPENSSNMFYTPERCQILYSLNDGLALDLPSLYTRIICPIKMLDEQSGILKTNPGTYKSDKALAGNIILQKENKAGYVTSKGDIGGASRFFYVAKPSKSDRGEGNNHATVKPVRLMEYLIKMVTPQGGTVLEPFAGSGTTLLAAEKLHMRCIAFELDPHHCDIIIARWEQMTGKAAEKIT